MTRFVVSKKRLVLALFVVGVFWVLQGGPRASLGNFVSAPEASANQVSKESTEESSGHSHEIFKVINFLLLAVGLVFVARKPLGEFFTQRSATIRKALDEGRAALEASQAQLRSVEERLACLEREIADFRVSARREMEMERERLRRATAAEAEKILELARSQMEAAMRAARLELKTYASQRAVELAGEIIRQRLDDTTRARLFGGFLQGLGERKKN